MDGSERRVLIDQQLKWPNGLALDYEQQKLYWTDASTKTIQCADPDGTNRKV